MLYLSSPEWHEIQPYASKMNANFMQIRASTALWFDAFTWISVGIILRCALYRLNFVIIASLSSSSSYRTTWKQAGLPDNRTKRRSSNKMSAAYSLSWFNLWWYRTHFFAILVISSSLSSEHECAEPNVALINTGVLLFLTSSCKHVCL